MFYEVLILEHVEEYGDETDFICESFGAVISCVEGVCLSVLELCEGCGCVECSVEVEDYESESAVGVQWGETFYVVLWPVSISEIELYGHVVDVVVYVDDVEYSCVGVFVVGVC